MNDKQKMLAVIAISLVIIMGILGIKLPLADAKKAFPKTTVTIIIQLKDSTISKVNYEGVSYLVNSRGGIVLHKPN